MKIIFFKNFNILKYSFLVLSIYLTGCSSSIYSNSDITYKASKPNSYTGDSYTLYNNQNEQFNPAFVDRALYSHQKVGKRYKVMGKYYTPKHEPYYDVEGIASWYGDKFHGKPTATGEIYNQYDLTVAHKTLPLNSLLYVTNLEIISKRFKLTPGCSPPVSTWIQSPWRSWPRIHQHTGMLDLLHGALPQ